MEKNEVVDTYGEWITYRQAQEYACLGRTKLTEMVMAGEIPAAKIGKAVRISRSGLEAYMRKQQIR